MTDIVATASSTLVKGSVKKVSLLIRLIRGKSIDEAFDLLYYSNKAVSSTVAKLVKSAYHSALSNGFSAGGKSSLIVSDVCVGKSLSLKRGRARSRGRYARYKKYYSRVKVFLSEVESRG